MDNVAAFMTFSGQYGGALDWVTETRHRRPVLPQSRRCGLIREACVGHNN